jgi:hypothetical protein
MPRKYNMTEAEFSAWFRSQLEPDQGGCLIWKNGKQSARGYGWLWLKGRPVLANRVALELKLGRPISDGMFACHTCDNPPCCNPEHLEEGTNQDNMNDKVNRRRQSKMQGEVNGTSKLTADQVVVIRALEDFMSPSELAKVYDVSSTLIRRIQSRIAWKHVA